MERKQKEIFQEWLVKTRFSHFITIEPTPDLPFTKEEIIQRFRTIEFWMNKKYLKPSFLKWDNNNKFWFIAFAEGDGMGNQIHYHLLLHAPKEIYRNKTSIVYDEMKSYITHNGNPEQDITDGWMKIPSLNPFTRKERSLYNDCLHIEKIRNSIGSAIYCSKWVDKVKDEEDYFFITPPKNATHKTGRSLLLN